MPEIVMNLRPRLSSAACFCNPHKSNNPREIAVNLQYGFFGHIVSLTNQAERARPARVASGSKILLKPM
jgi:hypothetical protein